MTRVLSCIQPTGDVHLGNYLGALRVWAEGQHEHDAFHGIVDLHALTVPQLPGVVGQQTIELAAILFAVGLDPDTATVFVQSHVHEHSQLAWIMECTVSVGELQRMVQYKDKAARQSSGFISAGLLTYPALQAADILLYDTDEVPVGDDQRQHVELTRDIAQRFNQRFGETFTVPEGVFPDEGARIKNLQEPERLMSTSAGAPQGVVRMIDPPDVIRKKFRTAVTDSGRDVVHDPGPKPGVSNLIEIMSIATGEAIQEIEARYDGSGYGPFKDDVAEAVVALLEPIQARYRELRSDDAELRRLLDVGAEKAAAEAGPTLARMYEVMGFVKRG